MMYRRNPTNARVASPTSQTSIKRVIGLLLAALLLISACRATPRPTAVVVPTSTLKPPTAHSISIAVHDADTMQPVADAVVIVNEQDVSTNASGIATVEVPYGQPYTVQVKVPGYEAWECEADFATPGTGVLGMEAAIEPIRIEGQVTGLDGQGLSMAVLTLDGKTIALDSQGRFELVRPKTGDKLSVEHPGYVRRQIEIAQNQPAYHLALEPLTLTVSVRDRLTGQRVAGVSLCTSQTHCPSTDLTGTALLQAVAQGTIITVSHPSYHAPPSQALSYEGQAHLDLELMPKEMTATVRDAETGQAITNTILLLDGQILPPNAQGRYQLPGPTTPYSLFVKSPGYKRAELTIGPETRAVEHDVLEACPDPSTQPCVDIALPRFAVHGIYANFGLLNWDTDHMLALIDLVDRSPILNAIVVDVKSDYGYLAYQSEDPLVAQVDAMSTPRLPLEEFLDICKAKKIYTIARMVIFKDSPLVAARPELGVRHPNGAIFYDREGMAWADPTLPEVWEYNIAITKEIIALGFDEIQYDYLRFPSDSTSLAVVRALVYSVPSTLESRTAAIEGFVRAAKEAVDPTRAFLSADLFGYALSVTPEHDMRIGQRLMDLAPHVDYVCPMVYPSTFIPGNLGLQSPSDSPYEVVSRSMAYGLARTDTLLRPWLQGYWYERQDFAEQRRAAEEASDVGWCFWNARGIYDELFFVPPEQIEP